MKIDIERLIMAEEEEMEREHTYYYTYKNCLRLYPEYKDRCKAKDRVYNALVQSQYEIVGMMELIGSSNWKELYRATRAVKKWRAKTNYEKLITSKMQEQLGKYIFGDEYAA